MHAAEHGRQLAMLPEREVNRDTPIRLVLVAMTRIVAARMPTHGTRMVRSQDKLSGMNRTIPRTGLPDSCFRAECRRGGSSGIPSRMVTSPTGFCAGMTMTPPTFSTGTKTVASGSLFSAHVPSGSLGPRPAAR